MNAQGAIWVGFGMVFRLELVSGKGFRVVLLRVRCNGGRVQADKGSVHNSKLIELFHLLCHDFLQVPIVQLLKKTVIGPVRWQRFHDVKAAIMSNKPVVVQVISQVGDLREALALHDDECANHSFFREAAPSSRRSVQREIQMSEQFVIERSGALGCEQRYILNDFLSVDCGQPLSGWFFSQVNFTKKRLRFLYCWSDF